MDSIQVQAGLARPALDGLEGPEEASQGLPEALGPLDPGHPGCPGTLDPGIWDPDPGSSGVHSWLKARIPAELIRRVG